MLIKLNDWHESLWCPTCETWTQHTKQAVYDKINDRIIKTTSYQCRMCGRQVEMVE